MQYSNHFYCAHCHKSFWGVRCSHCGSSANSMQIELYNLYQAKYCSNTVNTVSRATVATTSSSAVSSTTKKEQSSWRPFRNMLLLVCALWVVGMYFPDVFDSFVSAPEATPIPTPIITPTPTPSPSPTPMPPDAYIDGGTVNMRTGPGTSYEIIRQYNYGDRLRIIYEMNGWYYVTIDGEWGYISCSLVSEGAPPTRSNSNNSGNLSNSNKPPNKTTTSPTEAPVRSNSQNEETVYITRTGEKYHQSWCRYLRQSKIAIDLEDAIQRGYDACKVCW